MRLEAYREEDCGDWYFCPATGDLHIKVAGADVWDQEEKILIALHELIEARLCFRDGVSQGAVDAFDAQYETDRRDGLLHEEGEPGDDRLAPYRVQHRKAMLIEHMMALFLGKTDYGTVA